MAKDSTFTLHLGVNADIQGRRVSYTSQDVPLIEDPAPDSEFSFNLREPNPKPGPIWDVDTFTDIKTGFTARELNSMSPEEFKRLYQQDPRPSCPQKYDWSR